MIHLRLVVPGDRSERVLELLCRDEAVTNVVHLVGAGRRPEGDVVLCDVAREDASVVVEELRKLGLYEHGSIAMGEIDTPISRVAEEAVHRARGAPADAVVWEEVEAQTSEESELSATFLLFMVIAGLIAMCGVLLDTPILIVGAMVVGPEFGPVAALCVAIVQRQRPLAGRSALALAAGFPTAIVVTFLVTLALKGTGVAPDGFSEHSSHLGSVISSPDFFAFFVAFCAGVAGMLSLTTAKSGALIGVLISVTTIPAAANVGVAAAYGDWPSCRGSLLQLLLNLGSIMLAGVVTLTAQRLLYDRRRRRHAASEA